MHVKALSISDRKGIRKTNIDSGELLENFGLAGDAHGGSWHRQVSLLAQESIDFMRAKGLDVVAGNFAENITTEGIDLTALRVGDHIRVGATELIISQLGKICHKPCAIFHQAGDCVMPREGIFGVVISGGWVKVGDTIRILGQRSTSAAIICTSNVQKESGEQLQQILLSRWSPGCIRFDCLNQAEDNLKAILQDLTGTQAVDRILIFDPTGRHQPSHAESSVAPGTGHPETGTRVCHCLTLKEVESLC